MITCSDARARFAETMEKVCDDHAPVVITRKNNRDILRSPFEGIGKPEPLKHGLAGYGSRRIDDEHRLVCRVEGGVGDRLHRAAIITDAAYAALFSLRLPWASTDRSKAG